MNTIPFKYLGNSNTPQLQILHLLLQTTAAIILMNLNQFPLKLLADCENSLCELTLTYYISSLSIVPYYFKFNFLRNIKIFPNMQKLEMELNRF